MRIENRKQKKFHFCLKETITIHNDFQSKQEGSMNVHDECWKEMSAIKLFLARFLARLKGESNKEKTNRDSDVHIGTIQQQYLTLALSLMVHRWWIKPL